MIRRLSLLLVAALLVAGCGLSTKRVALLSTGLAVRSVGHGASLTLAIDPPTDPAKDLALVLVADLAPTAGAAIASGGLCYPETSVELSEVLGRHPEIPTLPNLSERLEASILGILGDGDLLVGAISECETRVAIETLLRWLDAAVGPAVESARTGADVTVPAVCAEESCPTR